jgi:hypothetical protein
MTPALKVNAWLLLRSLPQRLQAEMDDKDAGFH